jgi:hypothetical protein
VFVPELAALAGTVPGLMCVSETVLARMADPGDEFVTEICAHEVAHLWFGSHVTIRWWDDLWLEEALATYLSVEFTGGWAGFGYREKARAYRADELPGRRPVSSPVTISEDGQPVAALIGVDDLADLQDSAALAAPLADKAAGRGGTSLADLDAAIINVAATL